jgi:hypothetical protein
MIVQVWSSPTKFFLLVSFVGFYDMGLWQSDGDGSEEVERERKDELRRVTSVAPVD